MLEIDEILHRIKNYNLKRLAIEAGVNYPTVWRLTKYPEYGVNYETVKKLSDYLEGNK